MPDGYISLKRRYKELQDKYYFLKLDLNREKTKSKRYCNMWNDLKNYPEIENIVQIIEKKYRIGSE